MPLNRHSRARLTDRHASEFPGETLFDQLGRTLCAARCLPRKELFEAWETCKRVRRRLRGGTVVDVAAGHGLVAFIMLLLDDSSLRAICIDQRQPLSFERVQAALVARWPRLQDRVSYVPARLQDAALPPDSLLIGVHACGPLTDHLLDRAITGQHRLAVLPCCHSVDKCDTGKLDGWLPPGLAVDATRAARLRSEGFAVHTATIPADITPENRLLIATPPRMGCSTATTRTAPDRPPAATTTTTPATTTTAPAMTTTTPATTTTTPATTTTAPACSRTRRAI